MVFEGADGAFKRDAERGGDGFWQRFSCQMKGEVVKLVKISRFQESTRRAQGSQHQNSEADKEMHSRSN